MRALTWARSHKKSLASVSGVAIGALTLTTMAIAYEGSPTTKVDLNDSGVWLTNSSEQLIGHFNSASEVIDGGLSASGADFDILQDERNVLFLDRAAHTLSTIDPAEILLSDPASIPGDAKVALGADTVAVLDRASGYLWVSTIDKVAGLDLAKLKPLQKLGKNADVTVGSDGVAHAVSAAKGEVVTVRFVAGETEVATAALEGVKANSTPTITAVGEIPVVLDKQSGTVQTPGGFRTTVPDAESAVLQLASDEADAVVLATTSQLVRVPFDGSPALETSSNGQGNPAAPVSLRGCSYGAWAGSARFVRDCAGDGSDVNEVIPGAETSRQLVFRVNRDVIVINDILTGTSWLADETLQKIDDWSVLTPPEGNDEDDEETSEETLETTLPERKEQNTPPTAADDPDLGVRPGATTILPVLDNDNDPDGDVLVASLKGEHPKIGKVEPILNGAALQIKVDEDATGSARFQYGIDDGRKGTDTAMATVTVHDWSINSAPKPKRVTKLAVETGGTVSYNVLPDWIDPDGDDVYLRSVEPAPGDEANFTTDGQITYHAVASLQGRKKVKISVADAIGEIGVATVYIDVRPQGTTEPRTNADHYVTNVDAPVTVAPLANDTSAGREPLKLTRVDDVKGATIKTDTANKQFTFRAAKAGVYYAQYQAAAGGQSAIGIVRIDVLDEVDSERPPIAVRDVALLPRGKETLIGVLANDSDPAGGVLVVQSVTVPSHSGVAVSVLNHETLRITDQGTLTDSVRVTYRISNGVRTAEGEVIIVPVPGPDKLLPPVANDDTATVRVGDVVTIPVLDNDTHPSGDNLKVEPELVAPLVEPELGEAFVSQNTVRFRASDKPGTAYVTYEASDSLKQKDAGYVTVQILPIDETANAAPRPNDLTARAVSGTTTEIAVPLHGIDSDGDSVELIGIASAPQKGRIVEIAQDYLAYQAFDDSTGVDAFTYIVRDRLGKEGTATIRVGIAPPETMNQAPYAVKDSVVVRPGRSVAVSVLANDSDPDGDKIALVGDAGLEVPDIEGLSARVSGDQLIVDVPDRELETAVQYTLRDARGSEAMAPLTIKVDDDVPAIGPIARDDRVLVSDVTSTDSVDLDILANDEDPDGTTASLDVEVEDGGELLPDGKVRVEIGEDRQLVRYTTTDQDGLSASAFLYVPALSELRPTNRITDPVQVVSGETKEIALADYITVAGGGEVRVTEAAKISAVHSDGSSLMKDAHTLVYTSAKGFFGQDGLTVEVTDGTGPDDPDGRKATLTIPIEVAPPANQQPVFVDSQVSVAPGEKAGSVNLAELTSDPDPADAKKMSYTIVGQPSDGVSARLDGPTLLVEADATARKGTATMVRLQIDDGTTEPVTGTVMVSVTASTRSMPVATEDTVDKLNQGESVTVDVLRNDVNPFPETPLEIVAATIQTGRGEVKVEGAGIRLTAQSEYVGPLVVRYRIQDATGDRDREVEGTLSTVVQGAPDAPGQPTVSSVQDRTVVLSWGAPANNGAPITHYIVRSVSGNSYQQTCESTTCTLTGLSNNVEYTFEVIAVNEVGESPASNPTNPSVRPDVRPDQPQAPKVVFGDGEAKVTWAEPPNNGSPITSYTLEVSPPTITFGDDTPNAAAGLRSQATVTGTSYTWTGMSNGTEYTFKVRAHNSAPEPSTWSNWSVGVIPAGPPEVRSAPTTTELDPVGDQAQLRVNWADPYKNGDEVSGFRVQVLQGTNVMKTVTASADARSQAIVLPTSETAYSFKVQAQNKAGWGEFSPASAPRRGVVAPEPPTGLKATAGDQRIALEYTQGDRNGATAGEITIQYRLNGGTWSSNWDGRTLTNLSNGTDYRIELRAVASVDGTTYAGDPSTAVSARPYGTPRAPAVSAVTKDRSVVLSWDGGNSDNGYPVTVEVSIDGGAWKAAKIADVVTVASDNYDELHTIRARAKASPGGTSPESAAEARTMSKPKPTAKTVFGTRGSWPTGVHGTGSCTTISCARVAVTVTNFEPGTYTVWCYDENAKGREWGGYPTNFPANGTVDVDCVKGQPGSKVWTEILKNGTTYIWSEPMIWPQM